MRIGSEKQQPVEDDGDAASDSDRKGSRAENAGPQQAHGSADDKKRECTKQATPEDNAGDRLSRHQYEPADRSRNQHRRRHFRCTASYLAHYPYPGL